MKRAGRTLFLSLCAATLLFARVASGASLEAPEAAGMRQVDQQVYVDPDMPADQEKVLLGLVDQARRQVGSFYGELRARPKIVFCATPDCYREFGAVGLGYTDGSNLVISPYGQRLAILAHELAHVEFSARVGGFSNVVECVPQWFDEGQAVMVSRAEEFSEAAWQAATDDGKKAPELHSLVGMADWQRLTGANGENMQLTYGTANREVSRWFGRSGPSGFQALLAALAQGELFHQAYARIEAIHAEPLASSGAERQAALDSPADPAAVPTGHVARAAW